MQVFQATDSLNKRMRLSAWVRSEGIESWAGLWMRVDGQQHGSLSFDNIGLAWINDVQFEEVGAEVPAPDDDAYHDLPEKPGNLDFAEDGV